MAGVSRLELERAVLETAMLPITSYPYEYLFKYLKSNFIISNFTNFYQDVQIKN